MPTYTTPFARNVLPRFAAWFRKAMDENRPDYLVPVERKGAHLLDSVIAHLRLHGRSPVRSTVLYKRAFPYLSSSALDNAKILLLDDSTHTGRTLSSYRSTIRSCGNSKVCMLACIGDALPADDPAVELRSEVSCFLEPSGDEYHEYLWQMSELVVARGLTPEVDHHQFRISTGSSLVQSWPIILSELAGRGNLDVHGTQTLDSNTHGATLHWPRFFPSGLLPEEGPVHKDGVIKLRLFADFARNAVTAIPMAFPELLLPAYHPEENGEGLVKAINEWVGSSDPLVELMLTSARIKSPETIFNAAALYCDFILMRSLVEILRKSSVASVTVTADRNSLFRLYGPDLATTLADRLDLDLEAGGETRDTYRPNKKGKRIAREPDVDKINSEVNNATSELLLFLKKKYEESNQSLPRHEWKTVGFGLAELRHLPPFRARPDGALFLSRCVDFGCAITGLVPYTAWENTEDGRVLVLRKYRTAETVNTTSGGDLEDYRSYQREVAAETVAAIANYVSRRSLRWKGRTTPAFVLDKIAAILLSAASEASERRALGVVAKEHGPEAAFFVTPLVGKPGYRLVRNVVSESYSIGHDGGIEPTDTFLKRYVEGSLRIARRDELLALEAYLQALIPVLDRVENVSELLTCWAVSANRKLGLDYVMADVDFAFEALSEPIEVIAGRRSLVQRKLIHSCKRATHFLGIARKEKLDQLTKNWWTSVTNQWPDPIAVENDLLRTLSAPREASLLYSVAGAYIHTAKFFVATVKMAEVLAMNDKQGELFANSEGDRELSRSGIIGRLGSLRDRLRSLRDEGSHSVLPKADEGDKNAELANRYKRTLEILRRYAAAFAWSYSRLFDLRRTTLPDAGPRNRTILFADLAGSTPAALTLPHDENVRWKNSGLNLLAQWGQAFGAWEGDFPVRKGDDICLEFIDPESAILCAAVAQEHLAALRSTGLKESSYMFRMAIDSFWVSSGDGSNRISLAMDRAAKTAKASKSLFSEETDEAGVILVTPEVVDECCERLRTFLKESADPLTLGEGDRGSFRPWRVNRCPLLEEYVQRLRAL